ncbi:site-2 protease family protein [Actinomadura citrea]|uniref:Zinc metalloprotease n=1 Tax=Actinomadura citrea TaxID=46158 RepID=A0A7Y9GAN7_9ACTN|nr:site-2 protease family protein [Actinomadura citrea]NYE13039.1 Zn-dependent protease [Actinomadura citrea]GGT88873.1 zinc metalloprotease [Actinomadura citrea]
MKQTFRLGTFRGISVGMHWSVLVIMFLIAEILARSVLPTAAPAARWTAAVLVAVLFMGSLAAHEFAHALVARRHGVRVGSITLWALGGLAELDGEPATARADLQIAGVGPLASAAAGAAFAGAWAAGHALGAPVIVTASLSWLAASNILIAVFNLLPGAPLDGGRILRALLWGRRGDRASATRSAQRAGMVLGQAMIGAGLLVLLLSSWFNGLWLAVVGWFIAGSARAEARWTDLREAAKGLRVADVMTRDPDHGWAWQPASAFVQDVAARSRQTVFPVVSVSGDPVGAVTVDRLARVPKQETGVTLADLSVPLGSDRIVGPEQPVDDLLQMAPVAGGLVAAVAADHHLLGIVTTDDLQRMMRQTGLRRGSPAPA